MSNQQIDTLHKVTKSNELVESTYRLNLQEHRIISTLISMVQPTDTHFQLYKFSVRDFAELIGVKGDIYSYIKKIITDLQEKTVEIPTEKSTLVVNWLASAEYFDKEGLVELEISSKLKPYLLELKERFTSYHLRHVLKLRSSYSVRIYELLKQYQFIKSKKRTIDLQNLREWLGFVGENANKYKQYGHFKSKVLKVAHKDINENTDIEFEFEEIKQGRKVVSIQFTIRPKETKDIKEVNDSHIEGNNFDEDQNKKLYNNLNALAEKKGYTISLEAYQRCLVMAQDIWQEDAPKQLYKAVEYVNAQKKLGNPVGFLIYMIQRKYEMAMKGYLVEIEDPNELSDEVLPDWFKEQKQNEQIEMFMEKGNEDQPYEENKGWSRDEIWKSIQERKSKRKQDV